MKKALTLAEYARLGMEKRNKCRRCGALLTAGMMRHEDHASGWKVKGLMGLQWLWFHCKECHYDTSFQTIGISRPYPTL
ncbi:MAG: hypothetical protein C3F02_02525 [Parcubacteria group bacterium]|nr:MAG: hypothetical protein C3F02_02525 [Parcubacteria group bacterium]